MAAAHGRLLEFAACQANRSPILLRIALSMLFAATDVDSDAHGVGCRVILVPPIRMPHEFTARKVLFNVAIDVVGHVLHGVGQQRGLEPYKSLRTLTKAGSP